MTISAAEIIGSVRNGEPIIKSALLLEASLLTAAQINALILELMAPVLGWRELAYRLQDRINILSDEVRRRAEDNDNHRS